MILYGIDYKKTTFVGYHHFSLGFYDVVAVFQNGCQGSIDICETRNMGPILFTRYF